MSLSHLLQIQALREALERAAHASNLSEERCAVAQRELQKSQTRARDLEEALRVSENRFAEVLEENRRLRNLMGKVCQDKDVANTELRVLLQELRDLTPAKAKEAAARRDAA